MPVRRIWTQFQDKTLKYLREDLNIQRWSIIAQKLQNDFGIVGRNQKQCRQRQKNLNNLRYHNHLDSSLKVGKLSDHEEKLLFNLHNKLGNRWAEIATYFQGRTDSSLKNIFHSKLRKGIRKFNRIAKDKFKQRAKTYSLNFLSKTMDKYQFQINSQTTKNYLDFDFLKQIQNKLIEYGGGAALEPQNGRMNEDQVFQDLNGMLSRIQQFQKPFEQSKNDSESESSEYFPVNKRRNPCSTLFSQKVEEDQNTNMILIKKRSSIEIKEKILTPLLTMQQIHQEEITMDERKSLKTETPLSSHYDEKLQTQSQEISVYQSDQNRSLEFQNLPFDDMICQNEQDERQKNNETEIYYRQIQECQCSQHEELFNLIIDNNFNDQILF